VSRARVIAASNRDLRQEVRKGTFRPDLYHRLSVFTLGVPPLRDMADDKLLLLEHFRRFYAEQSAVQAFSLDDAAERRWLAYPFPGNVRELRNIVIRLITKFAGQQIDPGQLVAELDTESMEIGAPGMPLGQDFKSVLEAARKNLQTQKNFNLDLTLQQLEKAYVEAALMTTQGNLSQAAKLLGIHRTTLYSRMQNYGTPGDAQDQPQ